MNFFVGHELVSGILFGSSTLLLQCMFFRGERAGVFLVIELTHCYRVPDFFVWDKSWCLVFFWATLDCRILARIYFAL